MTVPIKDERSALRRVAGSTAGRSAIVVAVFVAALWGIEVVDAVAGNSLDQWGIHPRVGSDAVRGIAAAPLLHGGWEHLAANSVPALILGFLGLIAGAGRFLLATAIIWLVSGVGVWLTGGTNTVVIGLSGVLFGWMTYLALRGLFTRKPLDIIVGVTLMVLYGGMLWGVLPGQPGVSWQAHLWGAVGGVLAAVLLGRRARTESGPGNSREVGAIAS
ncbi:rhomboid family intramembrane serine protease [Tsukamurella tyrosinosolvens]|uniref:rhomboid family intramembrane serine protease n=1 Tax=Tsukamurella tyrosinosolvens TaxID=57704 RepID=UPI000797B097|nr:rhomboid family intramembrane serine protease [Tsukamurella tyrosinosolvens]KXP05290.1 rhomboid family intramembrane serine protease [Tsukamurella tyrosinosolvens]KZL94692.1 rhomboid family intramembrane serine protease [Tsukamurella tyrosinosolvens]MCA4994169.1 rhomboid family intramembrane serine protease [Tsukamurella tyrosinosolvens]WEL94449.1 rhomboid family intramembrane serine protease [Tsukamurella tyrosinosolvens]